MISKVAAISAIAATALAAYTNDTSSAVEGGNSTTITTDITVTDYVTYCPETTTVTITKCSDHKCVPIETVFTPGTVTITGECVIPTVITTDVPPHTVLPTTTTATGHEDKTVTECVECEQKPTTEAPQKTLEGESKPAPSSEAGVSTFEGAANKAVVGAVAGVAAVAAALL